MQDQPPVRTFTTDSVREAERFLAPLLAECCVRQIEDESEFRFSMEGVKFGRASLMRNQYAGGCLVVAVLLWDDVLFVVGEGAPSQLILEGRQITVSDKHAAIVPPGAALEIRRPTGSTLRFLKATIPDLMQHLENMTGRPQVGRLQFAPEIPLTSGPGALVNELMTTLERTFKNDVSLFKDEGLRKGCDFMLMSAMLSLPSNFSHELAGEPDRQAEARMVHTAEQYLLANIDRKVTIHDVVKVCGCRKSKLFEAFRSIRRYSPMGFLAEQRFQKAWALLMKPIPGATVTSIALRCGFPHQGRFSQAYRARFGEKPSETLRRGKEA